MASSGVSRLHSHDISNGKVYGMVQATQDVLLWKRSKEPDHSGQETPARNFQQAADAKPGLEDRPVGVMSENVLIDREMPLHVSGEEDSGLFLSPELSLLFGVFVLSLKNPKLPSLSLFLADATNGASF